MGHLAQMLHDIPCEMDMDISGFGNGVEKIKHSWRKMVLTCALSSTRPRVVCLVHHSFRIRTHGF